MSKLRSLALGGLAGQGVIGGRTPDPPPLPPIPTRADPEIEEARRREREAQRLRQGRRAQILTSGAGHTAPLGSSNRPTARAANLLGGG